MKQSVNVEVQQVSKYMVVNSLLIISLFQGGILGGIILKSPLFKSKANKYLTYSILSLSALILTLLLDRTGVLNDHREIRILDDIEWALIFPVFILKFVLYRIDHPIRNSEKLYFLYIPIFYSIVLNIYHDLGRDFGLYSFSQPTQKAISIAFEIEHLMVYLFLPLVIIWSFTFVESLKDFTEKKWLKRLLSTVLTLIVLWIIMNLLAIEYISRNLNSYGYIICILLIFLVHWLSYFGVYRYKLAHDQKAIAELLNKSALKNLETSENVFPVQEENSIFLTSNIHFQNLERLMKEDKLFLDSTITREKVAELLGISSGYLSQLVNRITEKNFSVYLNEYRVEAVKSMITDPEFRNYSLVALGLESGFTSKTTFFKTFKNLTGQTPSAYKRKFEQVPIS